MRVVECQDTIGVALCTVWDHAHEASGDARDHTLAEVMTGIVESVAVGDILLVHAGTALLKLPSQPVYPMNETTK
jgi:hypothetical protein